jgi:glyoxylase-like metal-dependent hydrolase (beta-lactamase superfamily II)
MTRFTATQRPVEIGDLELWSLMDCEGSFGTYDELFPGVPRPLLNDTRSAHPELFDGERWLLPQRSFLVRGNGATILIDTGMGPPDRGFIERDEAHLPDELERIGVGPEDIDVVLLTHSHADHVGWNLDANGEPTFPRATYYLHASEWSWLLGRPEADRIVEPLIRPLLEAGQLELFSTGWNVTSGVTVLPTPGHTPGHTCVAVTGNGTEALILGDAAVHPMQFDDVSTRFVLEEDAGLAARTRAALASSFRDGTLVACGHFPGTGIGEWRDSTWRPLSVDD